jgi:Endonuclease related to archaeal Holliday junction resolvase
VKGDGACGGDRGGDGGRGGHLEVGPEGEDRGADCSVVAGVSGQVQPADARFIGSPIDYLIFRNMSKGDDSEELIEIVLLDVKTGKSGLNGVQKKIEAAAAAKRVSFEVLRMNDQGTTETRPGEIDPQQLKLSVLPTKDYPHPEEDEDATRALAT